MNGNCLLGCGPARHYCHKESADYLVCTNCGLIFQKVLPSMRMMSEYAETQYDSGSYREYVGAAALKYETFRQRMALIKKRIQSGRLLDAGCSSGFFMEVALQNGFDAYGIEMSSNAISFAKDVVRGRITQGDVNMLGEGGDNSHSYDVVVAFDIIEHTHDPLIFLQNAKRLIRPGGCLVLSTPNTGHYLRFIMGSRWPMLQPMQHTYLFSKKAIGRALEITGYRDIQTVNAHKALSIEYLINQIRYYNPLLYHSYRAARVLLPVGLRNKPFSVNIGEILILCSA
jgi:2-polyprenyl-3-methyl-5-hydroxy-6-metoxy-1,4-benzoquinol methylase